MPTYDVEVQRTLTTDVRVDADSADAAAEKVQKASFPLPAEAEAWSSLGDQVVAVRDETGAELWRDD